MTPSRDADALAERAEGKLAALQLSLREDLKGTNDPQFRAVAETAAEVLGGLKTAFADFRAGEEEAWR